jgi:Spy/CpxP family protein refolding chaperone
MKVSPLILSVAIFGLIASPAVVYGQAENQRRGARSPEEQIKMLKENLTLTDEQVEKLKPIFAKQQDKSKALRDDQNLSQDDRRAKMREIYQGTQAEVQAILTPEQQTKYKEYQEKRRAERGGNQ